MSETGDGRPPGTFRLAVTGNDAQGSSYFVRDEFIAVDDPGPDVPPLFHTTPDQLATYLGPGGEHDVQAVLEPFPLRDTGWGAHETPSHGAVTLGYFRLPGREWDAYFDRGDEVERRGEAAWRHGFHRHRTIDYITITQGEFWLYLEQGEVSLQPGDVVIQRNTNHSWQRFDHPGVCGFVAAIVNCHGGVPPAASR